MARRARRAGREPSPAAKRPCHRPPQQVFERCAETRRLLPPECTAVVGEYCGSYGNQLAKVRDAAVQKWAEQLGRDFRRAVRSADDEQAVVCMAFDVPEGSYPDIFMDKKRIQALARELPTVVAGWCIHEDTNYAVLLRPEAIGRQILRECTERAQGGFSRLCATYKLAIPGPTHLHPAWLTPKRHSWEGEPKKSRWLPCGEQCGPTYCMEVFGLALKKFLSQRWGPSEGGMEPSRDRSVGAPTASLCLGCYNAVEDTRISITVDLEPRRRGSADAPPEGLRISIEVVACW
eukprot:TRINITY_DN20918_c0_g3_i1.p1 TRINITY_DN20918_c0_g3~~TRINITY_DN20918_c0_g3_i1.p1  ORF type:complete len:291 (+),score=49.73 TRINITY_DN20918_c0_g3_i1:101-973(+)